MTKKQYEELEAELDAINYSAEVWTEQDLARQAELVAILDAAGRL